jgi:biopolymer transport protein TolR
MAWRTNDSQKDEAISGINIVPIIDVTLVLLVILLIMSPIINLPNLPVELPEAMTKESKDQNITVSLGSDGRVSIDLDIVEVKNLPALLAGKLNKRDKTVVVVRADKSLPYGKVEDLIRVVNRAAGEHAVAIATQQRTKKLEGNPAP